MAKMTRRDAIKRAAIATGVVCTAGTAVAVECIHCKGSGTNDFQCNSCDGTGKKNGMKCFICNGKGFQKCSFCFGTGKR